MISNRLYWLLFVSYFICLFPFVHGSGIPVVFVELVLIFLGLFGGGHDGVVELAFVGSLLVLFGQISYLSFLFLKRHNLRLLLLVLGPILQITGTIILVSENSIEESRMTYYTLLPYLILTIVLLVNLFNRKETT